MSEKDLGGFLQNFCGQSYAYYEANLAIKHLRKPPRSERNDFSDRLLVIQTQLEQRGFAGTIYAIGDGIAPPKGTPDPEILIWIEDNGCLLVTNNRASMPVHLQDHLAQNQHIAGIIQLPKRMNVGRVLEDLILIGEVSNPDEFQDQIVYLPLA